MLYDEFTCVVCKKNYTNNTYFSINELTKNVMAIMRFKGIKLTDKVCANCFHELVVRETDNEELKAELVPLLIDTIIDSDEEHKTTKIDFENAEFDANEEISKRDTKIEELLELQEEIRSELEKCQDKLDEMENAHEDELYQLRDERDELKARVAELEEESLALSEETSWTR